MDDRTAKIPVFYRPIWLAIHGKYWKADPPLVTSDAAGYESLKDGPSHGF